MPDDANAWRIPLSDLSFTLEERRAVDAVLASGWLTMGPLTERFERAAAERLGVPGAALVSSGTAALWLALRALAPEPGRTVIVPAITFAATANVALVSGHRVVLCDIASPERPVLCPDHLDSLLRRHPNAVVAPVHYAGCEAPVADVLARHPEAETVEDAAHALGGWESDGATALGSCGATSLGGSRRALGCFSFFSNKNLATGEGGLVVSRDPELLRRVRLARSHGLTRPTWERHRLAAASDEAPDDPRIQRPLAYDIAEGAGLNFRPTEIVAALALERLPLLDERNARRRRLLAAYREGLAPAGVRLAFEPEEDARSAAHIAAALFPSAQAAKRAQAALAAERIQTSHHYAPLHLFACHRGLFPDSPALSRAEAFASRELTLPLFPEMTLGQIRDVCEAIRAAL